MTREEREKAIEIIRKYECNAEHYEACEAIIKASEQEPIVAKIRAEIEQISDEEQTHDEKWATGLRYAVKIIDKYMTESEDSTSCSNFAESSQDCISREGALNGLIATDLNGWQLAVALEAIEKLSPVTSSRPNGSWIETSLTPISGGDFNRGFKCSCCDYITVVDDFNYCPNCGAKITVEDYSRKRGINMAEKVEVVIKIPKYYLTHPQDYSCLAECVRRGKPLPEHGRLIDADELKSMSYELLVDTDNPNRADGLSACNGLVDEDIDLAPTIIEGSDADEVSD